MKHTTVLVLIVVAALVSFAIVALAQQGEPEGPMMSDEAAGAMTAGPMGGMMGSAAIAVSGNDIYVVAGGMLVKYDSDLTLVKQTELPMSEMAREWMHRPGVVRPRGGRGMRGGGDGMGPGRSMMR